jgi:hypothetical protein
MSGNYMQTRKVAGMEDVSAGQLKRVIESQHGVASTFANSVRVHRASSQPGWDGMVHVFALRNHPSASHAFAWSSDISGGRQPRYFAVLKTSQIATPLQAVKAAASAINKWGAQGTPK